MKVNCVNINVKNDLIIHFGTKKYFNKTNSSSIYVNTI